MCDNFFAESAEKRYFPQKISRVQNSFRLRFTMECVVDRKPTIGNVFIYCRNFVFKFSKCIEVIWCERGDFSVLFASSCFCKINHV